jgi:endonuclease I
MILKKFCKITFLWIVLFFLCSPVIFAQAGTYYDALNPALSSFITDLEARIRSPYTQVSYDNFDETNVTNFASRDTTGGQRVVTCVYSNEEYVYTPPFAWGHYSREHTWCQSWMPSLGSTSSQEGSDQHHIFPVNQNQVNGVRSNHPLSNVVTPTKTYLSCKYGTNANGKIVFEPRESHKGDAARALFYMAVRYNGIGGFDWTFNNLQTYLLGNSEDSINVSTLIQWAKQDPPDKWEIDRNNYVQSIQGNRNPFIDHPEYINYINFWNLSKVNPSYSTEPANYPTNFTAATTGNAITVSWTDAAAGTQSPSGYLLIAYNKDNYFLPIDGEVYTDDNDLSDGKAVVNIPYSDADSYTFNNLTANTHYYFTIYSYNGNSTSRNYKINGTLPQTNKICNAAVVVEPTVQPSSMVVSNLKYNGVTLSFTAGNGSSRIVLIHANSSVDSDPADGTTYTANSVYGSGSQIGTGNYVVSTGNNNSVIITGLNPNAAYYFKVYEYNGSGGAENYLLTNPLVANITTSSVTEPVSPAANIVFSEVTANSMTLTWTAGSGDSKLVLIHSGSSVNSDPVDGTTYSSNSVYGSGQQIGTGNYVVSNGSSNTVTVTGLTANTTYYFKVYEYNGTGGAENYLITSPASGSQATTTASTSHLVISEIYGGGGNSGALYKSDYIVLYNPTNAAVNLSGWSVQYAAATGTFSSSNTTNLSGTISSKGFYLIQEASGSGGTTDLPTPNLVGTIAMSSSAGKLALVQGTSVITGKSDLSVIDFVGFGTTANEYWGSNKAVAPSNTASIRRKSSGTTNTNDNYADFETVTISVSNPPLPVELQTFNAAAQNNLITLKWTTATEINSSKFEIEYKNAAIENSAWINAGSVPAGVISNSPKSYIYQIKHLAVGKYILRLKMIDNDGTFKYSDVTNAEVKAPVRFSLNQNYPNPFNPSTNISYELPVKCNVKLAIYNTLGQQVKLLVLGSQEAGYHSFAFSAGNLSSGIYYYTVTASTSEGNINYRDVKKLVIMK